MKGNSFSRKFSGQIQTMGKGGIQNLSNSNAIQSENSSSSMKKQQKQNKYQINNNNSYQNDKKGIKQRNKYEISKNQNNNPLIRNANMILNNNLISKNNNKQKAKSAKKLNDINNNSNNRYQNNQMNYNLANNNKKSNNNKQIMSQVYNNQYNSNNNPYNSNNNNIKLKNKNNIKNPIMNKILNTSKDYQYIEFQPYSLKDYKELTRNPVVMGPLGANIGSKDWESRKNRMKKMKNYSNNINKEHKGIISLKKDSPQDEIEKLIKERIEKGSRHKAYEYSKLVRAGKFKEDQNNGKSYDNYGGYPETDNDLYLKKFEDQLRQETENIYNPKPIEPPPVEEKVEPKIFLDIDQLMKQKEAYRNKIKDIRDTLLD